MSRLNFPSLTVADEIGLFPFLESSPSTPERVAEALKLNLNGAQALLVLLTALGLLRRTRGKFHLTTVSRNFLLPSSIHYCGWALEEARSSSYHKSLREAIGVKAPKPTTEAWKKGRVEGPSQHLRHLQSNTFPQAIAVARGGDFAGVRRLLDVAGGSGGFCVALAQRFRKMSFTVLDLPAVCKVAKRTIREYGFEKRIATWAADMFRDEWPKGHDAVFFSNVFHAWRSETCLELATKGYDVLPPKGRIYVHETLLSDSMDGPLSAASFSMQTALVTEGRQYSGSEIKDILRRAGFRDWSIQRAYGHYSLVSAKKP